MVIGSGGLSLLGHVIGPAFTPGLRRPEYWFEPLQAAKGSETWSIAGGPGSISYDAASRHLIVWQSPSVHLQIEDFLATERAKKNGKPAGSEAAKEAPQ